MDFSAARVTLDDKALSLTPTEYKLLCALTSHPGQLLTRGQLLEQLWDKDADFVDEHTLTLNISRLRAKLGEGYIETAGEWDIAGETGGRNVMDKPFFSEWWTEGKVYVSREMENTAFYPRRYFSVSVGRGTVTDGGSMGKGHLERHGRYGSC